MGHMATKLDELTARAHIDYMLTTHKVYVVV